MAATCERCLSGRHVRCEAKGSCGCPTCGGKGYVVRTESSVDRAIRRTGLGGLSMSELGRRGGAAGKGKPAPWREGPKVAPMATINRGLELRRAGVIWREIEAETGLSRQVLQYWQKKAS